LLDDALDRGGRAGRGDADRRTPERVEEVVLAHLVDHPVSEPLLQALDHRPRTPGLSHAPRDERAHEADDPDADAHDGLTVLRELVLPVERLVPAPVELGDVMA